MTLTPLIPDPNHSIEEPDIPLSRHYTVILELMLARYAHLMDKSLRKTVAYIGKELE